mmetsp:Transcript_37148/g.111274  ORF Transcript_37148/g.111274 Transcript_37148/m.111274 type:complete len:100 (-) Transcript_37148:394-693(-)
MVAVGFFLRWGGKRPFAQYRTGERRKRKSAGYHWLDTWAYKKACGLIFIQCSGLLGSAFNVDSSIFTKILVGFFLRLRVGVAQPQQVVKAALQQEESHY